MIKNNEWSLSDAFCYFLTYYPFVTILAIWICAAVTTSFTPPITIVKLNINLSLFIWKYNSVVLDSFNSSNNNNNIKILINNNNNDKINSKSNNNIIIIVNNNNNFGLFNQYKFNQQMDQQFHRKRNSEHNGVRVKMTGRLRVNPIKHISF